MGVPTLRRARQISILHSINPALVLQLLSVAGRYARIDGGAYAPAPLDAMVVMMAGHVGRTDLKIEKLLRKKRRKACMLAASQMRPAPAA